MEGGISNKITLSFFGESADDDVKKIFIGVFPANFVNRFISFHNMISESIPKYPFVIMNTDRSDKKGTNWYSFFDLHPKKEIFTFDSFGFGGFKKFVIQDDQKFINKIFYGVEKFDKKDNKVTLVTLRFSIPEYKKLKIFDKLSETTVDLLHLINEYGKKRLRNEFILHLVDDQLQMVEKDTCGMYQIYLCVTLFNLLDKINQREKPEQENN